SLIELLIAMALTLFLVLGLATVYFSNEEGSVAQRAEATLDDNVRLAVTLLTTDIRQAGYHWNLSVPTSQLFTIIPDNEADPVAFLATPSNPLIIGTWHGSPAPPYGLAVSFQSDGTLSNCLGQLIPMGSIATDEWKVDVSTDQLECRSRITTVSGNAFGSYVPLVNNVEYMMVRFGIDSLGDGSVTGYVSPSKVVTYSEIQAVEIALLMASGDAALPQGDLGDVLPIPTQKNY
ncbi:type 4 fimbrial biogenesis transmembrane precursor pilW-related protein (pilW), partial [mine drainage metagenome]